MVSSVVKCLACVRPEFEPKHFQKQRFTNKWNTWISGHYLDKVTYILKDTVAIDESTLRSRTYQWNSKDPGHGEWRHPKHSNLMGVLGLTSKVAPYSAPLLGIPHWNCRKRVELGRIHLVVVRTRAGDLDSMFSGRNLGRALLKWK